MIITAKSGRFIIKNLCVLLLLSWLGACSSEELATSEEPTTKSPPNILLIISDDFGVDVTSDMYPGLIDGLLEHYGPSGLDHPDYTSIDGRPASTPTLNQLAQEGMVFTNVWAHPFCSPTRASLLTGLFGAKTKVLSYADPLSSSHTSFVQKLRDEANYSTAVFGKWHIAGLAGQEVSFPGMKPKQAGFDLFKGNLSAAINTYWDYDYQIQDADTAIDQWRSETVPTRSLPGIAATTYAPVVKAADTIDWIAEQEAASPDKPWFVWLAFNLSHATVMQQPSAMAIPNPDTLDAISYAEMEACGGEFGTNHTGTCSGEALMRGMTNSVDTIIGKVLAAVDDLDPNTYIIFIGDNGTPMYARPNLDHIDNLYISKVGRGKGTAYEGGARVPMAIRGPGIEANSTSTEFAHAADLFSTTLSLAGLSAPDLVNDSEGASALSLDAVSLAPILFKEQASVRDPNLGYILTESLNLMTEGTEQVGARNANFKVICTSGTAFGDCEFYNILEDPLEEYALEFPQNCENYVNQTWTVTNRQWHYCRLLDVIATESFL